MALTKTLIGSIVVLDLNPDGSLRASNVERQYMLKDGDQEIARPLERDVLTAETVSTVLPDHAALILRVPQLEADLAAAQTLAQTNGEAAAAARDEVQAITSERDALQASSQAEREALQAERDAAQAERDALQTDVAVLGAARDALQAECDALRTERDALQAEKDAAAARTLRSVSPLQARKVLKASGMLATVQAMVDAAPEDDDVRLAWDWALSWDRESPFVSSLGQSLGLTSQQIDELFALAARIAE